MGFSRAPFQGQRSNVFINELDVGIKCTLSKFANVNELIGAEDSFEGKEAFQ